MTTNHTQVVEGDDEDYEYEYSTTGTETFLVNLDLTTVNGPVKSVRSLNRSNGRKFQARGDGAGVYPRTRKPYAKTKTKFLITNSTTHSAPNPDDNVGDDAASGGEEQSPSPTAAPDDSSQPRHERLQHLDLHTTQPIISYQGELYSCAWVDTVGTDLFFSEPNEVSASIDPVKRTSHYDLLGVSRVKLVGRKGKVTEEKRKRRRPAAVHEEGEDDVEIGEGDDDAEADRIGAGGGKFRDARQVTRDRQADFLQRLAVAKKARGDKDVVRTFVEKNGVPSLRHPRANDKSKEAYKEDVENLNQRIVRGDRNAARELQELYDEMEDREDESAQLGNDRNQAGAMNDGNGTNHREQEVSESRKGHSEDAQAQKEASNEGLRESEANQSEQEAAVS